MAFLIAILVILTVFSGCGREQDEGTAEQTLEEKGLSPVSIININKTIRDIIEMTGFANVLSID